MRGRIGSDITGGGGGGWLMGGYGAWFSGSGHATPKNLDLPQHIRLRLDNP